MNQAVHNLPPTVRGDTVTPWSVTVTIDNVPASIDSARLQFRLGRKLVAQMVCIVTGSTVEMQAYDNTSCWPIGMLDYDLELTLTGGRVITWLKGTKEVKEDYTHGM